MIRRMRWIPVAVVAGVLAAGVGDGAAIAAGGGDGSDMPITGTAKAKAEAAALARTGGGQVTGTEIGDEDSFYEVEVTLPIGSQVDVQLDQNFAVVGSSADRKADEGGAGDDGRTG